MCHIVQSLLTCRKKRKFYVFLLMLTCIAQSVYILKTGNTHEQKTEAASAVTETYRKSQSMTTTPVFLVTYTNSPHVTRQTISQMIQDISCPLIFKNEQSEIEKAKAYMNNNKKQELTPEHYINMTQNCLDFIKARDYVTSAVTVEENDFPLAYSILVYKEVELLERLLRAIYRPQNYYCIHIDKNSNSLMVQSITAITNCFQNVFVSSKAIDMQWGSISIIEAELVCMEDLWRYKKWKYFINLTGQDFPLKTNLELVHILKVLKGANVVDAVAARPKYAPRWTSKNTTAPHKLVPYKGSLHVLVNREFVDFVLHDNRSLDFFEWLKDTEFPDETFFSTLNHNPHLGIPGSFLGDADEYPQKPTFTRYKNWVSETGVWTRNCSGKIVRNICVLGVGDIHRLEHDIGLFANKFNLDFEHLGYDCMEELIYNRTRDQYLNDVTVDVTYYTYLDQVRLQLIKPSNAK